MPSDKRYCVTIYGTTDKYYLGRNGRVTKDSAKAKTWKRIGWAFRARLVALREYRNANVTGWRG